MKHEIRVKNYSGGGAIPRNWGLDDFFLSPPEYAKLSEERARRRKDV